MRINRVIVNGVVAIEFVSDETNQVVDRMTIWDAADMAQEILFEKQDFELAERAFDD